LLYVYVLLTSIRVHTSSKLDWSSDVCSSDLETLTKKNTLMEIVVAACEERKADNCAALDMQRLTPMTDYYVICNGNNERQVQAIASAVKEAAEATQCEVTRTEGFKQARGLLLALG